MLRGGLVRPYQSAITVCQQITDLFIVAGSLHLITIITGTHWDIKHSITALISTLLFFLFARQNNIYNSWRGQPLPGELGKLLKAWISTLAILLVLGFAYKVTDHFSRKVIAAWVIICPALLLALRVIVRTSLRQLRAKGRNTRLIVIAGAGPLGVNLAKNIMATPWMGIRIAGFYDDKLEAGSIPDEALGLPVIGSLTKLSFDARCTEYDEVYVALPMRAEKRMKELVRDLANTPIQVQYVPDIFTFNLINSRIKDIGGIPVIGVYDSPLDSIGHITKRAEDILVSTLILLLISIPMILISIAVKLSSPGPIFFKQRRYGLYGEEIFVWKFRSMTVCEDGAQVTQASKNDQRITRIGKILRQTSLDELPQFINVLQGSMSIVGPRPHAVAHNELYRDEIEGYMQRHLVKPGITGWAQINGWRGETDTLEKMEKRVEHDLHYIRNWSLWLDIKIIALTIFKGFIHKNAY